MKNILITGSLFIAGWFCAVPCQAQAKSLVDGLTFYAGFEKDLQSQNCAGAMSVQGSYVSAAGKVGKGFDSSKGSVSYPCAANLSRNKGSISFWVKPAVAIGTIKNDTVMYTTSEPDSMKLVYIQAHQVLYWLTAGTPPGKDWTWDWSLKIPVTSIPKDQWTHVVLTWDKRLPEGTEMPTLAATTLFAQKKIYINGQLAGSKEVRYIDGKDEGNFSLGGIPGIYDEVMVWDRVLSLGEVKQICLKPEALATVVRKLPPMSRAKQWLVYPELVYFNYADSLVAPGEAILFKVPLVNRTDKEQAGTLTLTMLDVDEKPQGKSVTTEFKLAPQARTEIPASFKSDRFGAFKIEATVTVGDKTESRDITSFGCIPVGTPPKHRFFGGHINQLPGLPDMARRLGFAASRCHNMTQFTWWKIMEPHRGDFQMIDSNLYDEVVRRNYDQLGQWFGSPYWSVKFKDGTSPPAPQDLHEYPQGWMPTDLDAYKNYVRQSIKRFPAIKEWEVWNEPWSSFFFKGSVEEYIELCKISAETARAIDPNFVIWSQFDSGVWGRAILKKGVLKYCDGLTYHGYLGTGAWDDAIRQIRDYRRSIKSVTGREDVPLMNSEAGIMTTTFLRGLDFPQLPPEHRRTPLEFRKTADRAVQYYVTTMAEGVPQWFYYFHQPVGPDNSYASWSTVEITRTPKPFIVALCQLAWQIDGGKYVTQQKLAGPVYAYFYDRKDGQSTAVLWTVDDGEVNLKFDGPAFDLMGNPVKHEGVIRVTPSPMYLRYKGKATDFASKLEKAAVEIVKAPVRSEEVKTAAPTPIPMADYTMAAEVGEARMIPLDIKSVVNMSLADEKASDGVGGWTDEGPFNDMRDLKPGRHKFLGVPFEIVDPAANGGKAVLVLKGNTLPNGPERSGLIAVGRKTRGLFFLHSANYAQVKGATAGAYAIRYADGKDVSVPITIATNIYDWWFDWQEGEDSKTVTVRAKEGLGGEDQPRFLRMWYWENPRREMAIESIRMTTEKGSPAALVLLGITAVEE